MSFLFFLFFVLFFSLIPVNDLFTVFRVKGQYFVEGDTPLFPVELIMKHCEFHLFLKKNRPFKYIELIIYKEFEMFLKAAYQIISPPKNKNRKIYREIVNRPTRQQISTGNKGVSP
jgi:hypothetical protein